MTAHTMTITDAHTEIKTQTLRLRQEDKTWQQIETGRVIGTGTREQLMTTDNSTRHHTILIYIQRLNRDSAGAQYVA